MAQNGYTIKIKTQNLKGKKLLLSYYNGSASRKAIVDSASINNLGQIVSFKQTNKIVGGIYQLKFAHNSLGIDIGIENGSMIDLTINNDTITHLIVNNSILNKEFVNYQTQARSWDDLIKFRKDFIKKYATSVVGLYFRLEDKRKEELPATLDEKIRFRDNFFNEINKMDKRLALLPNFYQFLLRYISILPITSQNYQESVGKLLQGVDCKSAQYSTYLSWIFKNIGYFHTYNLDEAYINIFKKYVKEPNCTFNPSAEYSSVANFAEAIEKLPLQSQVPDFQMIDSTNIAYKLSEIYPKSQYTFIAFYDPDCPHCKENMPKINTFFNEYNNPNKNVQKIAILNAPTETLWQAFIKQKKLVTWLHLKSNDPQRKYIKDFHAYTNPYFFLINQEGKIIYRSNDFERIKAFLKE